MWVRSQNGKVLINVNNIFINYLKTTEINTSHTDGDIPLGNYATPKRAMEVFNEIHNHIEMIEREKLNVVFYDAYLCPPSVPYFKIYEMPKE